MHRAEQKVLRTGVLLPSWLGLGNFVYDPALFYIRRSFSTIDRRSRIHVCAILQAKTLPTNQRKQVDDSQKRLAPRVPK